MSRSTAAERGVKTRTTAILLAKGSDAFQHRLGVGPADRDPTVARVDETGYVQPPIRALREVRGTRSIYHNNAIQSWKVRQRGG